MVNLAPPDDRHSACRMTLHWTPKMVLGRNPNGPSSRALALSSRNADLNGDTTVWTQHVPGRRETVLKMVEEVNMQRTESRTENRSGYHQIRDASNRSRQTVPRPRLRDEVVSADMPDAPVDDRPDTPRRRHNVWIHAGAEHHADEAGVSHTQRQRDITQRLSAEFRGEPFYLKPGTKRN